MTNLAHPFMTPNDERKFLRRAVTRLLSDTNSFVCVDTNIQTTHGWACTFCAIHAELAGELAAKSMMEDHELWPENTASSR